MAWWWLKVVIQWGPAISAKSTKAFGTPTSSIKLAMRALPASDLSSTGAMRHVAEGATAGAAEVLCPTRQCARHAFRATPKPACQRRRSRHIQ
jgi:hypothetical protein